jgi:hypothetical protein
MIQRYIHIETGEELLEFGLSGRIREIPNVKATTFSSRSRDGFLRSWILSAGVLEVVGEIVDGSRHCG